MFRSPLLRRKETNLFIVHHVGPIPAGLPVEKIDADKINEWHRDRRAADGTPWAGIAYNYVIKTDGTIERGRGRDDKGAHCPNHNWESIGICVVGDFRTAEPTPEQMVSLALLLAELHLIYKIIPGEESIKGHRDFNPERIPAEKTECPGNSLYLALHDITKNVVNLYYMEKKKEIA
jgi:hypothetical protein